MAKGRVTKDIDGFKKIVAESHSIAEIIRKMGYKEIGGVYVYLKQKFVEYDIDVSHFRGQAWSKGKSRETDERVNLQGSRAEKPWEEVFAKNSGAKNSILLRRLLLSKKREYKCEECGIQNWQGKPIRLQIDHVNGDRLDNREENLKIVCPNCHSQTETYAIGNKRKADEKRLSRWWEKWSLPSE